MAEAEYRTNILVRVLGDIIWYITQLSVFEVLFYHAPQIAGWNIHSMRVFMGVLFISDACYMILFHDNFEHASASVRKGELDFVMLKPINSQFMFSCRKVNAVYLINLGIVICYLTWALGKLPALPGVTAFLGTFLLMIAGLIVLYSLRFFFAGLNVILTNASSLTYVWYQFYRLGNRPHALYPPWLRWIVLTIFPVGLIVSVPATNLVQGTDSYFVWASPVVAGLLLWLSSKYWNYILRFYSSASS